MDSAAFATWRVGIELLNSAQRSLAYQDLALAEANDVVEYRDDEIDETTQEDRAEAAREGEGEATPEIVAPAAVGPSPAPDLLSKVGDGYNCRGNSADPEQGLAVGATLAFLQPALDRPEMTRSA